MPTNERLRQQRVQRNWRQQDMADQLGTTVITIQRWERGKLPSAYYRIKLCALFGLSAQELGLAEAPLPPKKSESDAPKPGLLAEGASGEHALWTVPYLRNTHFTGRDALLSHLEQQFAAAPSGKPSNLRQAALTQSQAIKGLGGIGKTQIAVEYAYRAREQERYTHTLWITAASEESILTSFVAIAGLLPELQALREMDQRALVTAVLRWLEQCEQAWLLILDNADDLSLVQPYLPRLGNGSILLTTRANAVGSLALPVEVDTMGVQESIQLLLRRAQRLAHASANDIDEAGKLVVELGQFPLALDQAGAYIEEAECSIYDYLQLYQRHRRILLARRGRQATGYPQSVATTWSLSFEQVEQTNPAAAELLQLCAFLSPDHIPEELLIKGAPYWPPLLRDAMVDLLYFNQMLETLQAFSLVKRLPNDHLLSIHRLVQAVQMDRLPPEEQRQWAERMVLAVHASFPHDPEHEVASWAQCQRYLEQAQACDILIQHYQILLPEAAEVQYRTGTYLQERSLYTLAEPLYQQALHIWKQQQGTDHTNIATSQDKLAALYLLQGKYGEAELLHQQALDIREQQKGPEHPDTAESVNNLAEVYQAQGKYAQAELFYQRAIAICEKKLDPEDPDTAICLTNLANLYRRWGKYTQAEPLHLRALQIWEHRLGPEHHYVASSLYGLGILYQEQGRDAETELLYQKALHIWKQQLGTEHLMVANALNRLATLYLKQEKYGIAEPMLQRARHIREQQLKPEHPYIASSLHALANLYRQQKQYAQAEPLYQQALQIYEQLAGPEHPETAQILHNFAKLQQAQGQNSEAASLYQRALTIRERIIGADHPLTADTREHLHAVLTTLNHTEKAANLEALQ